MKDRTPLWHINPIKGKWEWDALRPGIRLFLESHPQKVADLGSDFGLVGLQNSPPWLDSHPGPQIQYHGGQNTFVAYQSKASGSGTPSGQASGCFWSHTLRKLLIWAQILVSLDCKTPWLDSHPGPRFQYHGTMEDRTPLWHINPIKGKWERDAVRPGIRLFLESHPQKVADLGSDFGLVGLQNTLA